MPPAAADGSDAASAEVRLPFSLNAAIGSLQFATYGIVLAAVSGGLLAATHRLSLPFAIAVPLASTFAGGVLGFYYGGQRADQSADRA